MLYSQRSASPNRRQAPHNLRVRVRCAAPHCAADRQRVEPQSRLIDGGPLQCRSDADSRLRRAVVALQQRQQWPHPHRQTSDGCAHPHWCRPTLPDRCMRSVDSRQSAAAAMMMTSTSTRWSLSLCNGFRRCGGTRCRECATVGSRPVGSRSADSVVSIIEVLGNVSVRNDCFAVGAVGPRRSEHLNTQHLIAYIRWFRECGFDFTCGACSSYATERRDATKPN